MNQTDSMLELELWKTAREEIDVEYKARRALESIIDKIKCGKLVLSEEEERAVCRVISSLIGNFNFERLEEMVKKQLILQISGVEDAFGEYK